VLNCRQVSHLVSEAQDRRLGLVERWRLHVHLKVCEGCRHFQDHMQFMRSAVHHHPVLRDEDKEKKKE
jgi:Putative zinc-finger